MKLAPASAASPSISPCQRDMNSVNFDCSLQSHPERRQAAADEAGARLFCLDLAFGALQGRQLAMWQHRVVGQSSIAGECICCMSSRAAHRVRQP